MQLITDLCFTNINISARIKTKGEIMVTKQNLEKIVKENAKEYYKKHILGKPPRLFLGEIASDALIILGKTYSKLQVMLLCLIRITDNSEYLNTLNSKTQKDIHNTKMGIQEICIYLEEIIEAILKGIK